MRVQLNGKDLKLSHGDTLPDLAGEATPSGNLTLAPATITYLALPSANNNACRQS